MDEKKQIDLKPCPFCGGKAEIKSGKAYYIDCVYAHCTKCGASTPKVPINHLFYTKGKNVRLSEEQAKERATNDWNRREQSEGEWITKHRHRGGFRTVTVVDSFGEKHTGTLDDRWECDDLYCSVCGKIAHDAFLNYCANCGAHMKGGV